MERVMKNNMNEIIEQPMVSFNGELQVDNGQIKQKDRGIGLF